VAVAVVPAHIVEFEPIVANGNGFTFTTATSLVFGDRLLVHSRGPLVTVILFKVTVVLAISVPVEITTDVAGAATVWAITVDPWV
jgi:hypothetical protein